MWLDRTELTEVSGTGKKVAQSSSVFNVERSCTELTEVPIVARAY